MESLIQIDREATLWLNLNNSGHFNDFWHFMSGIREWFPLYFIIMAALVVRLGWKKGLIVIATLILGVVLTDQISNFVKDSVMRLRPCRDPWMIEQGILCPDGIIGGLFGFFSGHASNSFGFAAGTWWAFQLNDRKHRYTLYGCCIMVWATLVSLSRTILAAHYVGDILVGCLFGLALGTTLAFASYKLLLVRVKG